MRLYSLSLKATGYPEGKKCISVAQNYGEWLSSAGFENIQTTSREVPTCGWSTGKLEETSKEVLLSFATPQIFGCEKLGSRISLLCEIGLILSLITQWWLEVSRQKRSSVELGLRQEMSSRTRRPSLLCDCKFPQQRAGSKTDRDSHACWGRKKAKSEGQ